MSGSTSTNPQALDGASAQSRKILVMGHAVSVRQRADALSLTRIASEQPGSPALCAKGRCWLRNVWEMLRRANTYTETRARRLPRSTCCRKSHADRAGYRRPTPERWHR
ncbi:hypothetical protein OIU92_00130 [Escherichia coli]|nr:hypothetical protein [Escherichia coli]